MTAASLLLSGLSTVSQPKLVLRRLRHATSAELPSDLLRQASRRLEVMSLLAAALWVLGPVLRHGALLAGTFDTAGGTSLPVDAIAAGGFAGSLALRVYLRRTGPDPQRVIDLALLYLLGAAFAIGILAHWDQPAHGPVSSRPMLTWIGPVMLMLAAIVPVPPGRMLAASLAAAMMAPLGMLLVATVGRIELGAPSHLLAMHFPDFLLVGVAGVVSHVVTGLGREVGRARELGSYRLDRLLGEGGMGAVYRATHRMLARPAAIKLIRPRTLAGASGDAARLATVRFRREAEAAARLRSPHTVQLYDFGIADDGTLYTVMELLEGLNLQELVERHGPLPARRVVHVLRQVCESLEEAHTGGLIHRDIKPANIHLGRVGLRDDFVKVLDFGLVKSTAGAEESLETVAGVTPGTPAYMAPEMTDESAADGRADLYALGCVAWFLLTGRLVFEAATPLQMIVRHLQDTPAAPSSCTDQPIPAELDALVLACLAKDPADRPLSAREISRRLAAVPVEPWTDEHAAAWWAAHGHDRLTHSAPSGILTLSTDSP